MFMPPVCVQGFSGLDRIFPSKMDLKKEDDSVCGRVKAFFGAITIEPVMFLFCMAQGFYVIIAQSLYIAKVCSVNLNYTMEICDDIFSHPEIQMETQKHVSALQAYNGVLQAVPAIVYALFAGPWSDIHGRKVLMTWACFGYVFNNAVFMVNTFWWYELKAEFLLFECLQDCTGGSICFFLTCYSYIADISTPKTRTKRLAFLDGIFPVGFFAGMSCSGLIKQRWGFMANFGLGMGGIVLAVLYIIFFVKDSRELRPKEVLEQLEREKEEEALARKARAGDADGEEEEKRGCFSQLFDFGNLKRAFHTTFRKRPHNVRPYLLLLIAIFVLEIFVQNGKGPTMLLYLRKEFHWDENAFAVYMAFFGLMGMFTQYVAVPYLSEDRGWRDSRLGFVAVCGSAIQKFIMCFSRVDWSLYVGGFIAILSPCITTTCRAQITKCVGPFEVGAAFAVTGALQAMVPLVASPVFGFMYKATIETVPGAFLLLCAAIYFLIALLLVVVDFGMRSVERKMAAEQRGKDKGRDKEREASKLLVPEKA